MYNPHHWYPPFPLTPTLVHISQIVLKEFRYIYYYIHISFESTEKQYAACCKHSFNFNCFPSLKYLHPPCISTKKFIHHFRYYEFVLLFFSQLQHNLCFESIAILHVSTFSAIPKIIPYVLIGLPGWLKALVFSNPLPISDSIQSTPQRGMISLNTAWSGQSARSQHWMCVLPKRHSQYQTLVLIFRCFLFFCYRKCSETLIRMEMDRLPRKNSCLKWWRQRESELNG